MYSLIKGVIEAGTCPDLRPIPTKRDLQGRNSSRLAKRGGVYGPALSIPVGSYFCSPLFHPDETRSSDCSSVKPAWDQDKYLNEDYGNFRRKKRSSKNEELGLIERSTHDGNENLSVIEALSNDADEVFKLFERSIQDKPIRVCGLDTGIKYPRAGSVPTGNSIYGWVRPDVCGSFDWGDPLPARVGNTQYDSEHILEAQMIMQFFQYLNNRLPNVLPDPADPSVSISFCDCVNIMFDVDPITAPGLDTAQGRGAVLTPIDHIAAQFPTHIWNREECVLLEHVINTSAKGKAWGTDGNIINTQTWVDKAGESPETARSILMPVRTLIGSRLYHNDAEIRRILRLLKDRVGAILDLLDNTLLPNNPLNGYAPWQPMGLRASWDAFMAGQFLSVKTKTMRIVNEFLNRLKEIWTSADVKKIYEDDEDDDDDVEEKKQEARNSIDDIEAMDTSLQGMTDWASPF